MLYVLFLAFGALSLYFSTHRVVRTDPKQTAFFLIVGALLVLIGLAGLLL